MDALLLVLGVGAALLVAYVTYGRWVAGRVFTLREDAPTPATVLCDGRDYCPTPKSIVFGHHFTSIAGTGPIVGPAIAVMWGWLPAVLWVLFGSVFIGAVHDLGSIVVSLRNKGRSVGDIAGDLLGPRVRLIFLGVLVMALWIVLAIFGLVVASVLRRYPGAITPVLVQIPLAVAIGLTVHRAGRSILLPSAVALAVMYASVIWGDAGPLHAVNAALASAPMWAWVVGLLGYAYVASVLPVWTLLQPRDYINSLQLLSALGLLAVGLVVAATIGGAPVEPVSQQAAASGDVWASTRVRPPRTGWTSRFAYDDVLLIRQEEATRAGSSSSRSAPEPAMSSHGPGRGRPGSGSGTTLGGVHDPSPQPPSSGRGSGEPRGDRPQLELVAPMVQWQPEGAPPMLPVLFITIACGAVSGFHCLVGSGTTSKQINRETDARMIGYGSMLTEAFLATLVIAACAAGIGLGVVLTRGESAGLELHGAIAWHAKYDSWASAQGLASTVGAFVEGAANLIKAVGVPGSVAVALMGVLVASFAGTTMDTACRLQRYVIQELARTFLPRHPDAGPASAALEGPGGSRAGGPDQPEPSRRSDSASTSQTFPERDAAVRHASPLNPFRWLATTHGATLFAVLSAVALAAVPAPGQAWGLAHFGQGGLILWPLFGATNQLLGGLAFLVIGAWLIATKRPWWFIALPAAFMLVIPAWALVWQTFIGNDANPSWISERRWVLAGVAAATIALEVWLVIEVGARALRASRPRVTPSA